LNRQDAKDAKEEREGRQTKSRSVIAIVNSAILFFLVPTVFLGVLGVLAV
jgi:hypothetical protein